MHRSLGALVLGCTGPGGRVSAGAFLSAELGNLSPGEVTTKEHTAPTTYEKTELIGLANSLKWPLPSLDSMPLPYSCYEHHINLGE